MKTDFSKLTDSISESGIRKFFELVNNSDDIISLGVGEPDFVTPWKICSEAINSFKLGYTSYTSNRGLLELRKSIAKYLQNRFNCSYNPETEILITVGVSEAVDLALRVLLNQNDEVILPEPAYVCYSPLITLAGGKVVAIDTTKNNFVLSPASLEQAITSKTKALIICSPNNPTGSIIPKDTLAALASLIKKHNIWVISDEIYAELIYDQSYTSITSLPSMKERSILMNGFSKAYAMTGWRLGYLCGPQAFIERALKIHQYAILCAPIMAQYAGIAALKANNEIEEMRRSYLYRRNFFVNKLNEINLNTVMPDGAFYCFPSIKHTGLSSDEFSLKLLKQQKVAVVPGSVFGKCGEGFIRCCYATDFNLLKEAIKRIKKFCSSLKKK